MPGELGLDCEVCETPSYCSHTWTPTDKVCYTTFGHHRSWKYVIKPLFTLLKVSLMSEGH